VVFDGDVVPLEALTELQRRAVERIDATYQR
jgi:hypothetical protein